jgi:cell division septal protein FtsQ
MLSGAAFAACAAVLAACVWGPYFRITELSVSGTHHVTVDAVTTASGLAGAPTFLASAARARDRVTRLAAVRDARIEVILPDRATVEIVERVAIGRWVAGGLEWFVDDDGFLFPSLDPRAAPDLRLTDERGPRQAGDRLDPALVAAAMKLAQLGTADLRADATSPRVVLTAGANGLVLRMSSGWEIRFGGAERIDDKIALARRFLRENPQRKLDYLDVRTPDSVVVSPRS